MYFQNISISSLNAGKFRSPFKWVDGSPIFVQMTYESIKFYFETYDTSHPVSPHQSKVILYIPIGDKQKTGYTLLNLQTSEKELKTSRNNDSFCLFYGDVINNQLMFELVGNSYGHFFELLLCFFDDLINHTSDLNKYNYQLAIHTKKMLSQCEIFNLIMTKYSFYRNLKDYLISDCQDNKRRELNISYNLFLDEIVKGEIQRLIPGNCMSKRNWFSTPEEELEDLAKLDKKFTIDDAKKRRNDIQKAFLSKHDVFRAIKLNTSSYHYPIAANIISASLYLGVFVYWLTGNYENSIWFIGSAFLIFLLGIIIHNIQQGFRLNMLLPRIVISIATAWFMLIASEEILKNQLVINKQILIFGIPLAILLLLVFVFSEIKQYSPYYKNQTIIWRTLLIIIYSFNFSASLGFFAHPFVVNEYIQKSGVYENYIFHSEIDSLLSFKSEWENFRNKLVSVQSSDILPFSILAKKDLETSLISNKNSNVIEIFIEAYNNKIQSINNLDNVSDKEIYSYFNHKFIFKELKLQNRKDSIFYYSIVNPIHYNEQIIFNSIKICDLKINEINKQVLEVKNVLKLISLRTHKENIGRSTISGLKNNSDDILKYETDFAIPFPLFPNMFIFQTILVLLLSIVGQLIISDKKITESL